MPPICTAGFISTKSLNGTSVSPSDITSLCYMPHAQDIGTSARIRRISM